ncbi:PAS domain-containing protein [Granulicella tundricola]|uniref:histidine kinase n=1 Tax=Granulicella tundricola (strain ATCC BAA-1859 / DSM 23138 / MP5ACTX9) TaxID=1198114 RepID=E8WYM3_GRATM|nr:PAS domain-containing protein [Granulicella tundricola]ADW67621.1 PAS/PAC sensor signal transduction histidine kinase [Granulicella tundricola MP5ACTX9]
MSTSFSGLQDVTESRLRMIVDTIPAYIAYLDHEMRYVMVNRTYEEWFGRPAAEIVGRTVDEVLGDSAGNVKGHLLAALDGVSQQFEAPMRTALGDRYLRVQHVPDRDEEGRVRGVIVHGFDITERRNAEEALRESEERQRLALAAAGAIGTWDWDVQRNLVRADANFAAFYGVDAEAAAQGIAIEAFTKGVHPEDFVRVGEAIAHALVTGEEYTCEYRLVSEDGSVRWLSAYGRCSLAANGTPIRFPGVTVDITDRKMSEDALLRTEKLAAVGRLASSIAHEINNPLESVVNLLYLIEESVDGDADELRNYARVAQHELGRVSQIATQTLRFFKQTTASTEVNLGETVESVLALYKGRLLNSGVMVELGVRGGATLVSYEGELRQVLNNLVGNAIDAMRGGGRLVVRARPAMDGVSGRCGVRITVADTGMGMDAETARRIFEPFYTTKGILGTGLGLWVSTEIVQKHRGRLRVRSRRGFGTVFALFLPPAV